MPLILSSFKIFLTKRSVDIFLGMQIDIFSYDWQNNLNCFSIRVSSVPLNSISEYMVFRNKMAAPNEHALFINERGGRTSVRNVSYRLKIYAQTHDFNSHIHPHKLRHSFATVMLQNSHNIRAVQELLGHSQLTSTQIYTHTDILTLSKEYDRTHPRDRIEKKLKSHEKDPE